MNPGAAVYRLLVDLEPVPVMTVEQPIVDKTKRHRQNTPNVVPPLHALVARPVGKAEIRREVDAQKALDREWTRLEEIRCWEYDTVREWSGKGGVADEARRKGKKVHMGRIFELCTEKGSELPKGHKGRK